MELPDFLKPLEYLTQPFPSEAVAETIDHREESIPHLLRAIEWADTHPDEANDPDPPYMLHLFALYLLAEFREPRALAPIVQLFRNERYEELTDEVVTAGLPRILASVCSGDTSLIERLIEDDAVDQFVRGSAVSALGTLAQCGLKPRDELSAYFGTLLRRLKREPNNVWDSLVATCVDLGMTEHLGEIRMLYSEEVADELYYPLEEAEAEIPLPPDSPRRNPSENYELITDTIAEMGRWDCFDPNAPQEEDDWDEDESLAEDAEALGFNEPAPAETRVSETPKVGRNDPCPCGSGKKYKKCCG